MALDMHTVPGLVTGWDARDASALEWSDSERHTAHTLPEGLRLLDYEIMPSLVGSEMCIRDRLFVLLWLYARKERRERRVSAVFLIGYGVFRFTAEFFREPDDFLGLLALNMSMGQWLCVPMVVFGVWLYLSAPGPRRSSTAAA